MASFGYEMVDTRGYNNARDNFPVVFVQLGWTKAGRTPKYSEFVAILGNVILFRCFSE